MYNMKTLLRELLGIVLGFYPTFSRLGIVQASLALLIWLNETAPLLAYAGDKIEIDVNKRGNNVSPCLYGIFYEDINHAGDGGLYGELIKNRSFEDTQYPNGWHVEKGRLVPRKVKHHLTGEVSERTFPWAKTMMPGWAFSVGSKDSATIALSQENPFYASAPTCAKITIYKTHGSVRLINYGFWGIHVDAGEKYNLRTIMKFGKEYKGYAKVLLLDADNNVIGTQKIEPKEKEKWNDTSLTLTAQKTVDDARLAIEFDKNGVVWVDYVSLFTQATYKNRQYGMRKDLADMLVAMHPTFLRWPGGSTVGGITLDNRFDWKNTLGDPASRPGQYFTWGERCSYGFGYHEMLQFCEDMNMDAMFVCNAGMADMFRSGELCPDDSVDYFVSDCLDAIEYAVGDSNTVWGRKRVAAGHPNPFPLKYVEVGNEHYGKAYEKRFNLFYKAIKEKYPDITVVSNHFIDGIGLSDKTDMVDPHWYGTPNFYFNNTTLFDSIPRNGTHAYIGEWACNFNVGRGNMRGALAETAFLTGIERNADYVTMTSYAPLLQNVKDKDWNVNLIWFDNKRVVGRASYYAQCMASSNKCDYNVDVKYTGETKPLAHIKGKIGFGSSKSPIEVKNVRIKENGNYSDIDLKAGKAKSGDWKVTNDGILQQTGTSGHSLYVLNQVESNDFVLECDVKRGSFKEGVFLFYNISDNIKKAVRYNIGGWNCEILSANALYDGLDVGAIGTAAKCSVMPNEWHHVKLVVKPAKSTLILDNKDSLSYTPLSTPEHFVNVGMKDDSQEVIIKVVNRTASAYVPEIILNGIKDAMVDCKVTTLSAIDDNMENSFDNPRAIYPVDDTITINRNKFTYSFKPYSYTILRLKAN